MLMLPLKETPTTHHLILATKHTHGTAEMLTNQLSFHTCVHIQTHSYFKQTKNKLQGLKKKFKVLNL